MLRFLTHFFKSRSANVALLTAVIGAVLLVAAGAGLDLSIMISARTQLQAAADAAALAAIAKASPAYTYATQMTGDGNIPLGIQQAQNAFNANTQTISALSQVKGTYTASRTGWNIFSTVTATGVYSPVFAKLLGVNSVTLNVSSNTETGMQKYVNFYLALDVSGSMGVPSTAGEQSRLAAIDPDDISQYPNGCLFACHFAGYQGYTLTRNAGNFSNTPVTYCATAGTSACIQLRLDAVGYAVQNMITTATADETFPNQFAVGLYPFVAYMNTSYAPLTTNLSSLNTPALGLAQLLDTGVDPILGSGGTHFENALPSLNSQIASVGDGSAQSKAIPFVFMITDGAETPQFYSNGNWWGSNQDTTINKANCTALTSRGITVAILYIPYIPIPNPTDFAGGEDYAANANIPYIPPALTACASPGWFFTASTPADINAALQKMFNQAISSLSITS